MVREWGPAHRDVCELGVVRQSLPQVVERHTVKLLQLKLGCRGSLNLEDFLLELVDRGRIVPGVESMFEIR